MSTTEKRMLGDYEIIHSLYIGDREIVVGDNPNAPKDERYICMNLQHLDVFLKPEVAVVSDDFTEIIQEYGNPSSMKENEIVDGDHADDDGDRPTTDRGAR